MKAVLRLVDLGKNYLQKYQKPNYLRFGTQKAEEQVVLVLVKRLYLLVLMHLLMLEALVVVVVLVVVPMPVVGAGHFVDVIVTGKQIGRASCRERV